MNEFSINQNNETGRKTFLWYRVYLAFMVFLYLAVIVFGVFLAVARPATSQYNPNEIFMAGIIYAVVGAFCFLLFATALFLPRKPWGWIVGIVMIAIGMTSCCFLPFLLPLLIFWLKPETKAYFGRNS
ncbi:MAG TPA: hypothetical protein VK892_15760 [Pyrinomonadaceae bacterium]|nr:hypothetical protein [Pyrinomonadaceae bacterium]